jgi:hypothetical protein
MNFNSICLISWSMLLWPSFVKCYNLLLFHISSPAEFLRSIFRMLGCNRGILDLSKSRHMINSSLVFHKRVTT